MSGSIVLSCTCKHEFQDKQHGKNKRVHTLSTDKGGKGSSRTAKCTVCLKTQSTIVR